MVESQIKDIKIFLKKMYIGKDEDIYVSLLSLISHQHCLLLGPPGTAKSAILVTIAKIFDVPYFEYLLTKFTTPEELFGPINIKKLREEGIITYITKNKLPEAFIVFLDEVFKSSSVILNTLLTIINERKFYNGTEYQKVPLCTAFFASNELPEEELDAFYDRILFKHFSEYIKPELWEEFLGQYWEIHKPSFVEHLPKKDFSIINNAYLLLRNIDITPIKKTLLDVLTKITDHQIEISDRTRGRILYGITASAIYDNRLKVEKKDLYPLKYMIPHTKEEKDIVEQILIDTIGKEQKILQELNDLIPQVDNMIKEIEEIDDIEVITKYLVKLKAIKTKVSSYEKSDSDIIRKKVDEIKNLLSDLNNIIMGKLSIE